MFTPTRDQARRFLFETWRKYRAGEPLQGLETVALEILVLHPEYHALLEEPDRSVAQDYRPENGQANPFLHLSLHIAIAEQLAIDQPPGIRAEFERLLARRGERHDALHVVLDCLGEVLWRAQRDGAAPDGEAYLECLRRR